jgi:bacteriocin biosynthesis cyclodehydratase domain-containing protein
LAPATPEVGPVADDGAALLLAQLTDPDLHFPERPVFVEDLVCFEMPDGLGFQFRGGEAPVLVRGRLVKPALEYLRNALDGTRTLLELVRGGPDGLPASAVARTLLVLHSKGVIAARDPGPISPAREGRELLFWGRHLAITRSAGSATEVLLRAEQARIAVLGDGLFLAVVKDLLTRSGFMNITAIDGSPAGADIEGQDDYRLAVLEHEVVGADLLVTATVDASRAFLLGVNETILRSRTPWLMANWDGSTVDIGPLVQPGETACYECVLLRRASTDPLAIENALYQDHLSATGRTLVGEALWPVTMAASALVAEVARCVTGVAPPTLANAVLTLQPVSGVMVQGEVQRVPRCPGCYSGAIPPQDLAEPARVP